MKRSPEETQKDLDTLRAAVAATQNLQHGNTVYGGEHDNYDCPCAPHTRLRAVLLETAKQA
jgi:hypothetical protein